MPHHRTANRYIDHKKCAVITPSLIADPGLTPVLGCCGYLVGR